MRSKQGVLGSAKTIGGALVLILIVAFVLASIAGPLIQASGDEVEFEPSTDSAFEVDSGDELPEGFAVNQTTGFAVQFDGDGHVEHDAPDGWADGDHGVCQTAFAETENEQATNSLFVVDNRSLAVELHEGDWRAIKTVGNDTATATADATVQAEQTVCVNWDDEADELSLLVDGTTEDTATLTADSPDRQVANDWVGWIDELRLFPAEVTEATATEYAENPATPLDVDQDARLMFDEGGGNETEVFYQEDTQASLIGAEWTRDGVEGADLAENEDYLLETNPITIQAVDDGELDGAPIVYVAWDGNPFAAMGDGFLGSLATVLGLLVVGLLVVAAGAIMREFSGGGFGGGR